MQKEIFHEKAEEMGDFYLYHTVHIPNVGTKVTYSICTLELDNPYIKSQRRHNFKPQDTKAVLWDWKTNRFIQVSYGNIKKMVPLATVLKNVR